MVCACKPGPCSCHEDSSEHLPPGSLELFLKCLSVLIWSLKFPFGIENRQFSSANLAPLTYPCWFFPQHQRGTLREAACPSGQATWAHLTSPAPAKALHLPGLSLSLPPEPWKNFEEILKVPDSAWIGGGG